MRVAGLAAALLLMVATVVPAQAFNWSVGANLGYGLFIPKEKDFDTDGEGSVDLQLDNVSAFAWPSETPIPGIRFGFAGENPVHEFYIDTGLFISSTKVNNLDISTRHFDVTGNYQYNFPTSGSVAPYLTAGGGVMVEGIKDQTISSDYDLSATAGLFGGGVGIRHKMGNGHGVLRAEARVDYLTEGTDTVGNTQIIIQQKGTAFRVKLGFDLWDQ